MRLPQIGEVWKHYKGGEYTIRGFAWNAVGETLELCVLYGRGDTVPFIRTLANFLEPVDDVGRFRYIDMVPF